MSRSDKIFGGEPVLRNIMEHQLRFIIFLFVLVIIYISLHYAVNQTLIEKSRLERELKNLRAEYISCTAEFLYLSKREEISKQLAKAGSKVHAPIVPPKRIIMEE